MGNSRSGDSFFNLVSRLVGGGVGAAVGGPLGAAVGTTFAQWLYNQQKPFQATKDNDDLTNNEREISQNFNPLSGNNQPRLNSVVPKVFGTIRMFPKMMGLPYEQIVLNSDGEVELLTRFLYDFGLGDVDIDNLKTSDNSFSFENLNFLKKLWDYPARKQESDLTGTPVFDLLNQNIDYNKNFLKRLNITYDFPSEAYHYKWKVGDTGLDSRDVIANENENEDLKRLSQFQFDVENKTGEDRICYLDFEAPSGLGAIVQDKNVSNNGRINIKKWGSYNPGVRDLPIELRIEYKEKGSSGDFIQINPANTSLKPTYFYNCSNFKMGIRQRIPLPEARTASDFLTKRKSVNAWVEYFGMRILGYVGASPGGVGFSYDFFQDRSNYRGLSDIVSSDKYVILGYDNTHPKIYSEATVFWGPGPTGENNTPPTANAQRFINNEDRTNSFKPKLGDVLFNRFQTPYNQWKNNVRSGVSSQGLNRPVADVGQEWLASETNQWFADNRINRLNLTKDYDDLLSVAVNAQSKINPARETPETSPGKINSLDTVFKNATSAKVGRYEILVTFNPGGFIPVLAIKLPPNVDPGANYDPASTELALDNNPFIYTGGKNSQAFSDVGVGMPTFLRPKMGSVFTSNYKIGKPHYFRVGVSLPDKTKDYTIKVTRMRHYCINYTDNFEFQNENGNINLINISRYVSDDLRLRNVYVDFKNLDFIKTKKKHTFLDCSAFTKDLQKFGNNFSARAQAKTLNPKAGGVWTTEKNNSPAAAIAEILTGEVSKRPVSKDLLDHDSFKKVHDYCETAPVPGGTPPVGWDQVLKRYECNFVLDFARPAKEVIALINNLSQSYFIYKESKYNLINDLKQDFPVQIFTPLNSNSLKASRLFRESSHGFHSRFKNKDKDYQDDSLTEVLVSPYDNAKMISLDGLGVTNSEQARRSAYWILNLIKHRNESFTIETDFEYLVCDRGDYVRLVYPGIYSGGFSTRIKSLEKTNDVVDDSFIIEDLPPESFFPNYVQVRKNDGSIVIEKINQYIVSSGTILLDRQKILNINPGDLIIMGVDSNSLGVDCIVQSIRPINNLRAELTLIERGNPYDFEKSNVNFLPERITTVIDRPPWHTDEITQSEFLKFGFPGLFRVQSVGALTNDLFSSLVGRPYGFNQLGSPDYNKPEPYINLSQGYGVAQAGAYLACTMENKELSQSVIDESFKTINDVNYMSSSIQNERGLFYASMEDVSGLPAVPQSSRCDGTGRAALAAQGSQRNKRIKEVVFFAGGKARHYEFLNGVPENKSSNSKFFVKRRCQYFPLKSSIPVIPNYVNGSFTIYTDNWGGDTFNPFSTFFDDQKINPAAKNFKLIESVGGVETEAHAVLSFRCLRLTNASGQPIAECLLTLIGDYYFNNVIDGWNPFSNDNASIFIRGKAFFLRGIGAHGTLGRDRFYNFYFNDWSLQSSALTANNPRSVLKITNVMSELQGEGSDAHINIHHLNLNNYKFSKTPGGIKNGIFNPSY